MRFAVDAHAIGRHLTGNEVYVRSLLNAFGAHDRDCEFVAYVSTAEARAHRAFPDPDPPRRTQSLYSPRVRPRHEGPPGPPGSASHPVHRALGCPVPVVATRARRQLSRAPRILRPRPRPAIAVHRAPHRRTGRQNPHPTEFSRASILKVYGDLEEDKVVVVSNAAGPEFRPISRDAAAEATSANASASPGRSSFRSGICSPVRTISA